MAASGRQGASLAKPLPKQKLIAQITKITSHDPEAETAVQPAVRESRHRFAKLNVSALDSAALQY
jgi:hypothetical protein